MATLLKQSTTVTVRLGPFLDNVDGVTEETGITPVVEVSKNNGAFGARNSATAITHDSNGWYAVELDTTDTGTLGPMIIKSDSAAVYLPAWREFMVVPANVYNSLVAGSDYLDVEVAAMANGTITAAAIATGAIDADAIADNAIDAGAIATGAIDADAIADDAIDAGALKADAVTEIAAGITIPSAASIADAVWDELSTGHTDAGKAGYMLWTAITDIQTRLGTIAPTSDAADSFAITYGTQIANTYINTQTDDDTRHTLAPIAVNGLDVTYTVECGTGRAPTSVAINGYWNGSGQACDVYAYDFDIAVWDRLSNTTTRMASRTTDANYAYSLNREHMDIVTNPGNVMIRFVSASTNTGHRLYVDKLVVNTVADSAGATGGGGLTAQSVWEYVVRTLTDAGGEALNADEIADAVWDEARADHTAAGSFGEGVASVQGNVTGSVASVTGAVGSVTGNVGGNVAGSVASVTGNVGGNVVGSVASVTGAVGSVTGDVGGNVTGSVGSVASGGITAASIATGAIDADALATDAVNEIVDQVWNEATADHVVAGSTGKALGDTATAIVTAAVFPAGAIEFTYTVTNSITALPVANIDTWISTDDDGLNIIWRGTSDAFGVIRDVRNVKPFLDAGTYYFWRQKSDTYSFTNPDTETVS